MINFPITFLLSIKQFHCFGNIYPQSWFRSIFILFFLSQQRKLYCYHYFSTKFLLSFAGRQICYWESEYTILRHLVMKMYNSQDEFENIWMVNECNKYNYSSMTHLIWYLFKLLLIYGSY